MISRPPRARGFTIIEVLMVVTIMALLFGLVFVAVGNIYASMYEKTTKAMISRLQTQLEEYKILTGNYPPDGYDTEVKNKEGTRIWGSASVHHFLTSEISTKDIVAGQVRLRKHPPLVESFKEMELSKEDPEYPGVREILDGYGLPFHYDNTEDNIFAPDKQGEVAHMVVVENHPEDPRTSIDTAVVPHTGIQRRSAFDLWSHGGQKAHDEPKSIPLQRTIGTWNVNVERTSSKDSKEKTKEEE